MARCSRALQAEIRNWSVIRRLMRTIEMSEAGNCFMAFKDYFGSGAWAGEVSAGKRRRRGREERACRGPSEHGQRGEGLLRSQPRGRGRGHRRGAETHPCWHLRCSLHWLPVCGPKTPPQESPLPDSFLKTVSSGGGCWRSPRETVDKRGCHESHRGGTSPSAPAWLAPLCADRDSPVKPSSRPFVTFTLLFEVKDGNY